MSTTDEYSAKQIAEQLDVDINTVREALRLGHIPAQKHKGRWMIQAKTARQLIEENKQAVLELKSEIVAEYWQGYTIKRLQERAHEKVAERRVLVNDRGIAEQTIYEYHQRNRKSRGGALIAAS